MAEIITLPATVKVPDGWSESDIYENEWTRDPMSVTLYPHGFEWVIDAATYGNATTLAEACAAAERAYCGCYVRK